MNRERGAKDETCIRRFWSKGGCLACATLVGVVVGFALGVTLYFVKISPTALMWIGLPGELYMRMLQAAVLPLIVTSIITGTAGLKPSENGRISMVALTYVIIANTTGAVVGAVLAVVIKPGGLDVSDAVSGDVVDTGNLKTYDLFADLVRNLIPDNIITACFEKTQTRYKKLAISDDGNAEHNISADNNSSTTEEYERYLDVASGTNILGLVVSCAVIGLSAAHIGEAAKPFVIFFRASGDVIFFLVQKILVIMPVATASLIAHAVGGTADIGGTLHGLALLILAQSVGNLLLSCVVLPLLYFVFVRRGPLSYAADVSRPVLTTLVTEISAIAMPEIMKSVEDRHGVDPRVSRFVVPLVVAINRNGSALFITVTCIYMAQVQGIVSPDSVVLMTVLATVGALALPAMHSASIVTVLMILGSLGIPPANIGIVLALEWFSDRIRSATNACSHVMCCLVTWHFCKDTLLLTTKRTNGSQNDVNGMDFENDVTMTFDVTPEVDNGTLKEESSASKPDDGRV